jgi:hypothetical protein
MLHIKPATLREANNFIKLYHRHHDATQGMKFAISCYNNDRLVGTATAGRSVCRNNDQQYILEVTRNCAIPEDPYAKNACSKMYATIAQIGKLMGYEKIITYLLEDEPGITPKAAGWEFSHMTQGGTWNSEKRPRKTNAPTCPKQMWEKILN